MAITAGIQKLNNIGYDIRSSLNSAIVNIVAASNCCIDVSSL